MKVEILKENLKNGLGVVEKIVGKNLSLPILDNVLISTEDTFLSLSATDLETAIKLWILTKIVKKGKVVVPAKFLSSFVSLLPNEKITLEEKKRRLNNAFGILLGEIEKEMPLVTTKIKERKVDGRKT